MMNISIFQFFSPFFSPHLFLPGFSEMFSFGQNPLHIMFELQRFQTQMTIEQQRTKKAEEKNRKRQLGSIATTSFSNTLNLNEKQCVICLEEFEEGTGLKRLSCRHHYHVACIDKWLVQNGKCPLCNSKAVNTLEEVQSKFIEAKRLRENAQKRMRSRPHYPEIKAHRNQEIKANPANAAKKKLKSKKKRNGPTSLRRRPSSIPFPFPIFGGLIPPPPRQDHEGAVDSDEEEEQIQRAIRESLKEAEEMERKMNEMKK